MYTYLYHYKTLAINDIYNTLILVPHYSLKPQFCMQQPRNLLQSKLHCVQYFDINPHAQICMQKITTGCMQHFKETAVPPRLLSNS